MIQIDTPMLAIIITTLLTLLGMATAWGTLSQKVKGHDKQIEENRKASEVAMEKLHTENRDDHRQIFKKLEEINAYIRTRKE